MYLFVGGRLAFDWKAFLFSFSDNAQQAKVDFKGKKLGALALTHENVGIVASAENDNLSLSFNSLIWFYAQN